MPHGERSVADQRLHAFGQVEQAHQIRDMAARLADQLRERFLIMAEILDQPAIGARLFDRVEVLTLDILDQRDLIGRGIVEFAHECGNLVQPGALRSEEHTSELQSLMRISYAVFCLKKKHTK